GQWALALVCRDGSVIRCGGHGDIYKVDPSGAIIWFKYGYWNALYEPVEVSDGYIFPEYGSFTQSLFKTDFNGNLVWKTLQYPRADPMHNVIVKPNGNILALTTNLAIEFDGTGNYVAHQYYKDPEDGSTVLCKDIALLSDSTFLIAAFDAYVVNIKTDLSLNSGCADFADSINLIPHYPMNPRDTSYWTGSAGFITANYSVSVSNIPITDTFSCKTTSIINFAVSFDDTLCNGNSTLLSVNDFSDESLSWSWYDDLCGGNSLGFGVSLTVSPTLTQTLFLEGKGCDTTVCIPFTVNVLENANADFDVNATADCSGVKLGLKNNSSDADSFLWNVNGQTFSSSDLNLDLGQQVNYQVSLIAMNNNSCSDTMSVESSINSFLDYFKIKVPNVFTPNNDGENDNYVINSETDLSGCFQLKIFDRWGLEHFQT
ncbi:MAG: gliding motility-associated C-terminal domain-containing protein, partial [Bacteroidota bacterium]|nr:gliding motility-associated C-terminal domain-containing protein [Bacteroidota bacterium]